MIQELEVEVLKGFGEGRPRLCLGIKLLPCTENLLPSVPKVCVREP
jgi:hypothetical protein